MGLLSVALDLMTEEQLEAYFDHFMTAGPLEDYHERIDAHGEQQSMRWGPYRLVRFYYSQLQIVQYAVQWYGDSLWDKCVGEDAALVR